MRRITWILALILVIICTAALTIIGCDQTAREDPFDYLSLVANDIPQEVQ